MYSHRAAQKLCCSCAGELRYLLQNGFTGTRTRSVARGPSVSQFRFHGRQSIYQRRSITLSSSRHAEQGAAQHQEDVRQDNSDQAVARELLLEADNVEERVQQARQEHGEYLPANLLSSEELVVYERLFGPAVEAPDIELEPEGQADAGSSLNYTILGKSADSDIEEFVLAAGDTDVKATLDETGAFHDAEATELDDRRILDEDWDSEVDNLSEDEAPAFSEDGESFTLTGEHVRAHPTTLAGRAGTFPSTIQLPKDSFLEPTAQILSDSSSKEVKKAAHDVFGGPSLPTSVSTSGRGDLKQQQIALTASQTAMGDMEGNAFVAAVMPGTYAASLSTLTEVRKRLGPSWIRDLLSKDSGPSVLDAGSAGAAVLAWREILRAEWMMMREAGETNDPVPYGRTVVVTGSTALRHRSSKLLDNTTFIPRLPDYNPERDHPSVEHLNPQPRKKFDIIIAPHSLWQLQKDHQRKSKVQNLWNLLNPDGGVLILIEKGLPHGFELIAAARQTLLKYHIPTTSEASDADSVVNTSSPNRFGGKEAGMIIAPCTNHQKCPLYRVGDTTARKDFCHFSQRFIRPAYLQRILEAQERNHEDVKFSYIAVQRGINHRERLQLPTGQAALDLAVSGYERTTSADLDALASPTPSTLSTPTSPPFSTFSLPRIILPPIKRHGHVILDTCTPLGTIERWTVPRSFGKQAYRDARKSKWGDLWSLGAKTRVPRNIRTGSPKSQAGPVSHTRTKTHVDTEMDPDTHTDIIDVEANKAPKLNAREKRARAKREIKQRVNRRDAERQTDYEQMFG